MTNKNYLLNFSPLVFLASLGAGGISVIPFAILQYMFFSGTGLVSYAFIHQNVLSLGNEVLFRFLEGVMILFIIIHVVLSIMFFRKLISWLKTSKYATFLKNPLVHAGILAPFISFAMTFNVIIGPLRYFIPSMSSNLQTLMLPAFVAWLILLVVLLRMEIKLLKISFVEGFDMDKINFGWLLHPFALSMVAVTGAGIAAMAQNENLASLAAFFTLIPFTMGFFLFIVKLIVLFKSHLVAKGLPDKQFLPSFLIVIPNLTLFALTAFRLGHYFGNSTGTHVDFFLYLVVGLAFAFEIWYFAFGLSLMKDYFKNHYFKKEFFVTKWGLICPFVAFAVLSTFVYKIVLTHPAIIVLSMVSLLVAVVFYFDLLRRHYFCFKHHKNTSGCILKK